MHTPPPCVTACVAVQTVVRMREFALRAASEKASEMLPPQVMQGAAEDLGDLLRERCSAPWTFVSRVMWDQGPQELLRFLVDNETVLDDKVHLLPSCSAPLSL